VKSNAGVGQELTFHIVETNQPGLLGLKSSQDLGFIKVVMITTPKKRKPKRENYKIVTRIARGASSEVLTGIHWIRGLGETLTPVINPPRTMPAALRDRVKAELEDMELLGKE